MRLNGIFTNVQCRAAFASLRRHTALKPGRAASAGLHHFGAAPRRLTEDSDIDLAIVMKDGTDARFLL
jgi:hypothetical protein